MFSRQGTLEALNPEQPTDQKKLWQSLLSLVKWLGSDGLREWKTFLAISTPLKPNTGGKSATHLPVVPGGLIELTFHPPRLLAEADNGVTIPPLCEESA